jgi:hypothetical protein
MKMSDHLYALTAARKENSHHYVLNKRLCGPQNGSGRIEIRRVSKLWSSVFGRLVFWQINV